MFTRSVWRYGLKKTISDSVLYATISSFKYIIAIV